MNCYDHPLTSIGNRSRYVILPGERPRRLLLAKGLKALKELRRSPAEWVTIHLVVCAGVAPVPGCVYTYNLSHVEGKLALQSISLIAFRRMQTHTTPTVSLSYLDKMHAGYRIPVSHNTDLHGIIEDA